MTELSDHLLTADEVREELRRALVREGHAKAWARRHGFSSSFLSFVLNGERAPSVRLCQALGIKKTPRIRRSTYARVPG